MNDAATITSPVPALGLPTGQDGFSPVSVGVLAERGLTTTDALDWGLQAITSTDQLPVELQSNPYATTGAGILFPWPDAVTGDTVWQFRPDEPMANDAGQAVKYVFGRHVRPPFALIRQGTDPRGVLLVVEGSFQSRMAARYAPAEITVCAISGCWNFGSDRIPYELPLAEGRPVVICLDADAATNAQVYAAGMRLGQAAEQEGATSILFTRLAAGGTAGLDDVLAARAPERRTSFLARLVSQAKPKPADRAPKATKASQAPDAAQFLNPDGGLLVRTLADEVLSQAPGLLTAEHGVISFYRDGWYQGDRDGLAARMAGVMGDYHRSGTVESVRQVMVHVLTEAGRVAPELSREPRVCVPNGMLDLRTGELTEHHPDHLATRSLAIPYDPDMATPVYDRWCEVVGITDQVDDLEECVSQMLDPSVRPTKALFLFGRKRTGKSTYLRLIGAVAGAKMTSAVSLQELSDNQFAGATLYGKVANLAGELSATEVSDVTTFKKATGEDVILANRKYGHQFEFTNQAMFAFSANEVPPLNDPTGAATSRIKPFHFNQSFAGHENPAIERALMAELPGIVARWQVAWKRRHDRGEFLATRSDIRSLFLQDADQVNTWAAEHLKVHPVISDTVAPEQFGMIRDLFRAYRTWAEGGGRTAVGERRFAASVRHMDGVRDVRRTGDRQAGVNATVAGSEAGSAPGERRLSAVKIHNP